MVRRVNSALGMAGAQTLGAVRPGKSHRKDRMVPGAEPPQMGREPMAAGTRWVRERIKTGICCKGGGSSLPEARLAPAGVQAGSRVERCAGEVRRAEGRQGSGTHPLE